MAALIYEEMIKKIYLYILLMVSLASCSDDIFDSPTEMLPDDGKLSIRFSVPEMTEPVTRGEDDLGSVMMLVFPDNGMTSQIEQIVTFDNPKAGKSEIVTIKEDLRKNANLRFMFIANSGVSISEGETLENLLKKNIGDVDIDIEEDGNKDFMLVMSGTASLQQLLRQDPVLMFRNAAKVTVKSAESEEDYKFRVYGTAKNSPIMAGASNDTENNGGVTFPATGVPTAVSYGDLNTSIKYIHPTSNTEGRELKASYIIVEAKYGNEDYFYRLDFQTEDGEAMDINPNHYYEVQIKGLPRSAGFKTQEEAARNPVSIFDGWYYIHDHAPVIFNMVSDGVHELGVSHLIRRENTGVGTEEFYVKIFSRDSKDEENLFSEKNLTFEDEWIEIATDNSGKYMIEKVSGADFSGIAGGGTINEENQDGTGNKTDKPDYNSEGTVYKITVNFKDTQLTGFLDSKCTVNWKGLSRDIPVEWNRSFNPEKLFKNVKLTMKEGETVKFTETNYFSFLRGENAKVWGVGDIANNGEARDQGLHFPLQYGASDETLWTYEYEIELNDLGEGNPYSWGYYFEGDDAVAEKYFTIWDGNNEETLTGTGPKFKIKRNAGGWDYGVGTLVITVGKATYPILLYHTGFFHKDYTGDGSNGIGLSSLSKPSTTKDWTYYEVVKMGGTYWLDRNLGAHSAEMYVKTSTGQTYAGNPEAAGGYYRVAEYSKHNDPIMKESLICPPGYDFPTQHNFNELRDKSNFSTAQVGNYNTASYTVDKSYDGGKKKTVYFPKSLYADGENSLAGESRAGYYWTQTAASGTEKEEIGAWLKCFTLSGSSTSFMNGEVYCSASSTSGNGTRIGPINGMAMSVRCVKSGSNKVTDPEATSFFVKGATHVFFYTEDADGTNRSAITTWPGIVIGDYNTSVKLFNILYESSVNTPNRLYVIFNYKDSKGKIHSLSKNVDGSLSESFYSTTVSPELLKGWKVVGDDAPNWFDYGHSTVKTNVNEVGNDTKYYWMCDFNAESPKAGFSTREGTVTQPGQSTENPVIYRLYWHEDYGNGSGVKCWGINLFFGKPGNDTSADWGFSSNKWYSENTYKLENNFYHVDIKGTDWDDNYDHSALYIQGKTEKDTYDGRQPYVLKSDFEKTTIDGNPNYYCYTISGTKISDNRTHVNGHGGTPVESDSGVSAPEWDGKSYRLYVKPDGDNNNAFDCWYDGGSGLVKSFYTSNEWNNENGYYYIDFTNESDSFTLKWQMIYEAYISNNELTTNHWDWCVVCETASSSFQYESSNGKKCYTIINKTNGKEGKP